MAANLIGQTIGNYHIESLLGAGGMGEVYRARHLHLDRAAALKIMHASMAIDPGFQARFRQEARAIASLQHPHIVEIYDFGEQDGSFYLVMELLDDGTLRSLLRRRAETGTGWSLALALQLVAQAAEALHYAHTRGIVHRDVKPDNMLLIRDPQQPTMYTLKISDFGLAHLAEGSIITATGVTMGTPAYISPEQCQGTEIDARSDLYSLGVVLYEAVTGYLPFTIKTMSEAVYKHVYAPPPPPRQVCPELPEALEILILKCLAKKPEERFASGAELAAALRALPSYAGDQTTCSPLTTSPLLTGVAESPALITVQSVPQESPPPVIESLPGRSSTPRIQVLDGHGNSLRALDLTGDGLTIGRLPDNTLVLEGESISRHHVRVDWDGSQVRVTDLGSSNGTLLENQRITPNRPQTWNEREVLRIGPFWLRLEARESAQNPMTIHSVGGYAVRDAAGVSVSPLSAASGTASPLAVALENVSLTLTTGQPGVVRMTLANLGAHVEHLALSVEGVPASWVQLPSQTTQLNPGMRAAVALTVQAPRGPESRAGEYAVTIRAISRDDASRSAEATACWTVLPFVASSVALSPLRKSGRTQAAYTVTVRNEGNTPVRLHLSGSDEDQALQYRFDKAALALEPGESSAVPLTLEATRRWIGSAQTRAFTLKSESEATDSSQPIDSPHLVAGQFIHQALIPTWAPPLLIPLLALCALGYTQWVKAHQPLPPVKVQAQIIASPKGNVSPDQKLTIFGANLGKDGILYLNGDEVSDRQWSETQIVFHVPKNAVMNASMNIVVTPKGGSPLDAGTITIAPPTGNAQITSMVQGTVKAGQRIVLPGVGLGTGGAIMLGGNAVADREWTDTQVAFVVPKDAPADTPLAVRVKPQSGPELNGGSITIASAGTGTDNGSASGSGTPPQITKPAKGRIQPEQTILLTGNGLGTDGTLKLGDMEISNKKWSARRITFRVPREAPTNMPLAIVVTPQGGSDLDGGSVTVVVNAPPPPPARPTIASFTAASASVVADTPVVLSWDNVQNADRVELDDSMGNRQAVTGSNVTLKPHVKTTYTLTATGKGGTDQKTVTIAVVPAAPIPVFPLDKTVIRTMPQPGVFYIKGYMPYQVTMQWKPVDFVGGVTYLVETQWTNGVAWAPMPSNLAVSDTHYMVNYYGKPGITGARWRVHTISPTAGEGPSTDWLSLTFDNTPWIHRPPKAGVLTNTEIQAQSRDLRAIIQSLPPKASTHAAQEFNRKVKAKNP
jgi:serine/threonine protein kinase